MLWIGEMVQTVNQILINRYIILVRDNINQPNKSALNEGMDEDHEMFKIVVIGNSGTGKTGIATRYIRN